MRRGRVQGTRDCPGGSASLEWRVRAEETETAGVVEQLWPETVGRRRGERVRGNNHVPLLCSITVIAC